MSLEVELKLAIAPQDVPALARVPALKAASLNRPSTRQLHSVYYDTPQFALRDAGVALRLRKVGRRWVQTVKSAGRVDAGLHQRTEIETPVPAQLINYRVLSESNLADVLSDPDLPHALAPVFTTQFRRTTRNLEPAFGTQVELCVDRGAIIAGTTQQEISEVELEVKQGDPAQVIAFAIELAQHVPLRLEPVSKAERGYALAAGVAPAPVKARPTALRREMSVADAFGTIVFGCIGHLQRNEEGVLGSEDIEYVHQARVAVRRLRSAFTIFRPAFARELFEPQLGKLRDLASALGNARDWDVLMTETLPGVCEALPGEAGLHELMERCASLRTAARDAARNALGSKDHTILLLELTGLFLRAPWNAAHDETAAQRDLPLTDFAEAVLDRRHRKVMREGARLGELDAAQLHQLRLRIKKLRYSAEFFASLYGRKDVRDYVSALSGLQELLGHLNDAATADRIAGALRDDGQSPPLEGLGLLRGWCAARAQAGRERLPKAWKKFDGCGKFW